MVSDAVAGPEAPVRRWQPVEAPVPVLLGAGAVVVALTVAGRLLGQTGPTPGSAGHDRDHGGGLHPARRVRGRRLPGHPLGRLMVLAGLAAALNALAVSWSALLLAAWLSQWTWWLPWRSSRSCCCSSQTASCRPRGGDRWLVVLVGALSSAPSRSRPPP